jgi:hypothetical protein
LRQPHVGPAGATHALAGADQHRVGLIHAEYASGGPDRALQQGQVEPRPTADVEHPASGMELAGRYGRPAVHPLREAEQVEEVRGRVVVARAVSVQCLGLGLGQGHPTPRATGRRAATGAPIPEWMMDMAPGVNRA